MSRHNPTVARVIKVIEPAVQAAGYELVDVRFTLEQGGWVLRVAIDVPPPAGVPFDPAAVPAEQVSIDDCERMSRELSSVLDVEDPIPQAYSLEVSSPGIDRPLRTPEHFARYVGADAKIQLAIPLVTATGDRKNFKGRLVGVTGEGDAATVAIDVDGTTFQLAIADVDHARLVPDWDAVMRGGSGLAPKVDVGKPGKKTHRSGKAARA
jgi:ribosome maturation factor RimP